MIDGLEEIRLDSVQDDCPTCGRWLATYRGDTFDLAGKAQVVVTGPWEEIAFGEQSRLWALPGSAVCMRRRCRLKRWLRR